MEVGNSERHDEFHDRRTENRIKGTGGKRRATWALRGSERHRVAVQRRARLAPRWEAKRRGCAGCGTEMQSGGCPETFHRCANLVGAWRRGAVRVRCSDGMAWWIRAMESCGLYVQRAGRDGTCCAKGRMLAWELEERQNDTAFIRPTTHHAATIMIPGAVCCTENMKQGCGVVSAIT